jgi:hypothetical protein
LGVTCSNAERSLKFHCWCICDVRHSLGRASSVAGVSTVYLVGAIAVTLSSLIALYLMLKPPPSVQ